MNLEASLLREMYQENVGGRSETKRQNLSRRSDDDSKMIEGNRGF